MIRNLAPDEVVWFMQQAFAFAGHPDPQGLASRLHGQLRSAVRDAAHCYVRRGEGRPRAGVYLQTPQRDDAALTLNLFSVWHDGAPAELLRLMVEILEDNPHEEARLPLHLLPEERCDELSELLAPLGFMRDTFTHMRFQLTEVPPLATPLVLESYQPSLERDFRSLYQAAEGTVVADARWALLKRREGPFHPDLWFLARETLDQEPVGYAFCGSRKRGVDASYSLDAAGVLQRYREDSEMLRRLLVSTLHMLSGISPLGAVDARLSSGDPKLTAILASLGFERLEREPLLIKTLR